MIIRNVLQAMFAVPTPLPVPAIDSPGVRAALARSRRRGWAALVLGVALLVGFTVAATVVDDRAADLERTGKRVSGRVVGYSPGSRVISEHVDIEFESAGELRSERVQLDDESAEYEAGQSVVVFVDPDDADRLTIEGETNQSMWTVWLMVAALLIGGIETIAGPWTLVRTRRQRRLLAAEPWRRVRIRYLEVPSGRSVRGLVLVSEDGAEHVATVASYARWNLRGMGLRGTWVDIVGRLPGHVVVRRRDSDRLTTARSPYTNRARRRWRREFTDWV